METNSPPQNAHDEQFSEVQIPQPPFGEKLDVPRKKSLLKFVLIFLAIIIIAGTAVFVWTKYFSPAARRAQETQKQYEKYLAWQKAYEDAMRADTYGGKTPQETLDMFIDALRKEDVELASKYFIIEETGERDPKWLTLLEKIKNEGNIIRFGDDLQKYDDNGSNLENQYYFVYKNQDGTVGLQVEMKLNEYSDTWKIEDL